MRISSFFITLLLLFFSSALHAQLEKVIVEKYYVSDTTDAKDTNGGSLPAGSVTYRIYADLKSGCKLMGIYGDAGHALVIKSDSVFFNNTDVGQTFAYNIKKTFYCYDTGPLDTWLTLGEVAKPAPPKAWYGVLKSSDKDGSFLTCNDGGSVGIPLLANADSTAGLPVTSADGVMQSDSIPGTWVVNGIPDSSIFGAPDSVFISNSASLENVTGVRGADTANQILVAQLTTKGKIYFKLNLEIACPNALGGFSTTKYVAENPANGEVLSPYLTYPPLCGCTDPNYLEFDSRNLCSKSDSCKTRIVYGCMDPMACNFDASANFNVPSLCCYPGLCNDRDLSMVCPSLSPVRRKSSETELYPNPVHDWLTVTTPDPITGYAVYDLFGRVILEKNNLSSPGTERVDVSGLGNGLYLLRLNETGSFYKFSKE